jgi:hypothetical protein
MEAPVYGPRECGSCRLWRHILEDERGPIGPCRLEVRPGEFPGTAPICERYLSREEAVPERPAPAPRSSRPRAAPPAVPPVRSPPVRTLPSRILEEVADMTREEFAQAVREALREESAEVRLAPKWEGGSVLLRPGDPATQPKEIPLDALFHKVVMVRDRLRVLEQRINAHPKLSDAEKVEMQQYVTRCYGSLTTFNLLFREEEDRFVGDRSGG